MITSNKKEMFCLIFFVNILVDFFPGIVIINKQTNKPTSKQVKGLHLSILKSIVVELLLQTKHMLWLLTTNQLKNYACSIQIRTCFKYIHFIQDRNDAKSRTSEESVCQRIYEWKNNDDKNVKIIFTTLQIQLILVTFLIEIEGKTVLRNGSPTFANHHYLYRSFPIRSFIN